MTDNLARVLAHVGFTERRQQRVLYEALTEADTTGIIAQAGTGVGKSMAVLAAAAGFSSRGVGPALIVVPNNALLAQYQYKDAPIVEQALGVRVATLRGRRHYPCSTAKGHTDDIRDEWVVRESAWRKAELYEGRAKELSRDQDLWGCPGTPECTAEARCMYQDAKAEAAEANVIITNAHLFTIDSQLKAMDRIEYARPDDGEPLGLGMKVIDTFVKDDGDAMQTISQQPMIFPGLSAVFVDEAHQLEPIMRDFLGSSIPLSGLKDMLTSHGDRLAEQLRLWNNVRDRWGKQESRAVQPTPELMSMVAELAHGPTAKQDGVKKHHRQAVEAAQQMMRDLEAEAFYNGYNLLWFDPAEAPRQPRLLSSALSGAALAAKCLTAQPFALVSATVPRTMAGTLGVKDARFIDVGHPFDYARQASISFSRNGGSFKAIKSNPNNEIERMEDMGYNIMNAPAGGALILFSSFRDLEKVYDQLGPRLAAAGKVVMRQEREGQDKTELGEKFKSTPNAVLFGSDSFGTGFDAPGDALTFLGIWKVPYSALDPVTKAISDLNRQRYTDAMLTKLVQMIGRLIRKDTDVGHVFIADQRAKPLLLASNDPMTAHLKEFALR